MIKLQPLHNYPTTTRHIGWDPHHVSWLWNSCAIWVVHESLPLGSASVWSVDSYSVEKFKVGDKFLQQALDCREGDRGPLTNCCLPTPWFLWRYCASILMCTVGSLTWDECSVIWRCRKSYVEICLTLHFYGYRLIIARVVLLLQSF
jgi:hypothetical protein